MQNYEQAVGYIKNFLSENHYGQTLVKANERCFRTFGAYLNQEGTDDTPAKADEWFHTYEGQLPVTDLNHYKMALLRLRDIYECGDIRPEHNPKRQMSYTVLTDGLKNSLDTFLLDLGETLSPDTVDNYKYSCARFLISMQNLGVRQIGEITFELLYTFHQTDIHHGKWGKGRFWNHVSREKHEKIKAVMLSSPTASTWELYRYKEISNQLYSDQEYGKTTISANNRALDLLILFLEMSGYQYNPEIVSLWFEEVRPYFKKDSYMIHRSLCMVADYYRSAEIRLEKVYRTKLRAFELLPEWCHESASRYVAAKEKEGWAKSTLNMIRSSICRFCSYLDGIGVRSFSELDTAQVKQFNRNDKHKTPFGKNAYNTRIRKFLIYLGEYGYLDNPMLFLALTHTGAQMETIVVILTKKEMEQLDEELGREGSQLSIRKKAMLLLGLKMGLRASDIVNLKIGDINWDTASIRFVQEKTAVEVNLPMPTEVGNMLFRYIMEERQNKKTKEIFLSEKAPHNPVSRAACGRALDTALPDRNVEGSGFHVTRKTYATNLLRDGVGAVMVAEALGQRGTSSVHRYLSLDVERMCMCPLSLADYGIREYVPHDFCHFKKALPHIFAPEEIRAFFSVVDSYIPERRPLAEIRLSNEYRLIFRWYYCCGLRNSEAAGIASENVDLNEGILTLLDSKGNKDRLVYLPADLRENSRKYYKYLADTLGYEPQWFFPGMNPDKPIPNTSLDNVFNRFWQMTCYAGCRNKPTIHDFRFTFVVNRMNQWAHEGVDLQVMMPYLSRYLGHKTANGTLYYYYLVSDAYRTVEKKDTYACTVIPEVYPYE